MLVTIGELKQCFLPSKSKAMFLFSLSIIYAVFTVSNMVAAPFVAVLTPKWSMMIGVLCYAVFQVGFYIKRNI